MSQPCASRPRSSEPSIVVVKRFQQPVSVLWTTCRSEADLPPRHPEAAVAAVQIPHPDRHIAAGHAGHEVVVRPEAHSRPARCVRVAACDPALPVKSRAIATGGDQRMKRGHPMAMAP
jgi:hypothetical protein